MSTERPDALGIRASDTDRNAVTEVLSTAYVEGRLTSAEHDERLSQAMQAVTLGDLTALTADLVPLPTPPVTHSPAAPPPVDPSQATSFGPIVAVFGGSSRRGAMCLPATMNAWALFGGIDLEFDAVTFETPTTVINVANIFGGTNIYVPEGVRVVDETVSIFGGTDVCGVDNASAPCGAPTIILRGVNLFGGLAVYGPNSKGFGKLMKKRRGADN